MMILFAILFSLSFAFENIYKVEPYCPFSLSEFQQSNPRLVNSFATTCDRIAVLFDEKNCRKGYVKNGLICELRCSPCKKRTDFCSTVRIYRDDVPLLMQCFNEQKPLKKILCTTLFILTRKIE